MAQSDQKSIQINLLSIEVCKSYLKDLKHYMSILIKSNVCTDEDDIFKCGNMVYNFSEIIKHLDTIQSALSAVCKQNTELKKQLDSDKTHDIIIPNSPNGDT